MKTDTTKYKESERVLCYHGPLIYEAKCLRAEIQDGEEKYYIHYAGWNKHWDEWVPESRVLKYNDQNLQKQRDLQKQHKVNQKSKKKIEVKGRKSSLVTSEVSAEKTEATEKSVPKPAGTRVRKFSASDYGQIVRPKVEESELEKKVICPDNLKVWLLRDQNLICTEKKRLKLPASLNIDEVMEKYVKHVASKGEEFKMEPVIAVTKGICEYFNTCLSTQLLYSSEKECHAELVKANPDVPLTSLYGPVHLLRLLVKLPNLISYSKLIEKGTKVMENQLNELYWYLQENCENIFTTDYYEKATSDRRSLSVRPAVKSETQTPDKKGKKDGRQKSTVKVEDEKSLGKDIKEEGKRKREIISDSSSSADAYSNEEEGTSKKRAKVEKASDVSGKNAQEESNTTQSGDDKLVAKSSTKEKQAEKNLTKEKQSEKNAAKEKQAEKTSTKEKKMDKSSLKEKQSDQSSVKEKLPDKGNTKEKQAEKTQTKEKVLEKSTKEKLTEKLPKEKMTEKSSTKGKQSKEKDVTKGRSPSVSRLRKSDRNKDTS